jgi:hypothetical protein
MARRNNPDTQNADQKLIQEYLLEAQAALDKAVRVADSTGESFSFLDQQYTPKKTIVSEGGWNLDRWDSSNC